MNLLLTAAFVLTAYGLGRLLGGKSAASLPSQTQVQTLDIVSPDRPGVPHVVGPAPDFETAVKAARGLAQAHPGEVFIVRQGGSPVAGFRLIAGEAPNVLSAGDCAALIAQGRG